MIGSLAETLAFLAEHAGLIEAIQEAVFQGASKDELMKVIKGAMVAASDETMRRQLADPKP